MEIYGYIPESLLQRVELAGRRIAVLCRDYRLAEDEEARTRLAKELASAYTVEINARDRDQELGISLTESDALCAVVSGHPYTEKSRQEIHDEERAVQERNDSIFNEEAKNWKKRGR